MRLLSNDPDGDIQKYGPVLALVVIIYRMILGLWAGVAIVAVYAIGAILSCIILGIILKFIFAISSPLHYVW